jgi:hypothetical protein
MYLGQMTCEIILANKYRLRGLTEIEVKKSIHQIVQSAKLTLPLSVYIKNGEIKEQIKLIEFIKEGDSISLSFGYNGKHRKEFTGYIKRINPKQPLELELEDELYLLRKLRLKKSFVKNDVREVLTYLMDQLYAKFQVRFDLYDKMPQVLITNMMINGGNGIEVLQELSDKYFMKTYLTEINGKKVLYCGLLYGLRKNTVNYVFNQNTINISDLKYQVKGDMTFKVEISNQLPNGLVRKFVFGDPKGQELKLPVSGNKTEAQLKHIADALVEVYGSNGYKGKFETFLTPYVEPGCIAKISDRQFQNRKGSHYVGTVTTKFGINGGRRYPEIDILV